MSDEDIRTLTKFFSIPRKFEPVKTVTKMDRHSLAIRYRELIDRGCVKNQADPARHLGVSRAWITKVMNELKRGDSENENNRVLLNQSVFTVRGF